MCYFWSGVGTIRLEKIRSRKTRSGKFGQGQFFKRKIRSQENSIREKFCRGKFVSSHGRHHRLSARQRGGKQEQAVRWRGQASQDCGRRPSRQRHQGLPPIRGLLLPTVSWGNFPQPNFPLTEYCPWPNFPDRDSLDRIFWDRMVPTHNRKR